VGNGIKIAIGVPHTGDIPGYFFDTVLALSAPKGSFVTRAQNKPVDVARNMIVETALADPDVTHLFFMDADMIFHPDTALRLVQRDKDVIGGTYFARTEDSVPHIYRFHHEDNDDGSCPFNMVHEEGIGGRWYLPVHLEFARFMKRHKRYAKLPAVTLFPDTKDTLVKADALGSGCMMVKREVLERVGFPWFKCHDMTAGGEDFFFCERAKQEGFEVWGDFSVQAGHEFRHAWIERNDFMRRFRIGQEDEYDFTATPVIVDVAPKRGAK
jgi:hypothetical protein